MHTTTAQAHDRRQMLLLASVAALTLQACLGLIAYPAAPASAAGISLGPVIAPAFVAGVALHRLHPELAMIHKAIGAVLIGATLGAGIGGLDAIEHVDGMAMAALRLAGRGAGMLATGLFWAALFAGTSKSGTRKE